MEIVLRKQVVQAINAREFLERHFDIDAHAWSWRTSISIDLDTITDEQNDLLKDLFRRNISVRGVTTLLRDMELWDRIVEGGTTTVKARTVRQFEAMIKKFLLLHAPGQRLYRNYSGESTLCYYVNTTEYHPPRRDSGHNYTAECTLNLLHTQIGGIYPSTITFSESECRGFSPEEALALKGYMVETPALRTDYLISLKLYDEMYPMVGKQYWATGIGIRAEQTNRWWNEDTTVVFDRNGEQARVVVDIFDESGKPNQESRRGYVEKYFWQNVARKDKYNRFTDYLYAPKTDKKKSTSWQDVENPEEEPDDWDDDETTLDVDAPTIPTHPFLIVFDLARHLRLRAHVRQLTPYIYDTSINDKLILPDDQKQLVSLLINTRGGTFRDIIANKGGGAVILLTGAPGLGKTLTAEVYAEAEQRALYSIQCSQLGTTPDALEKELLKLFDRARRWNAVMLLDEADVYVRRRGGDLIQNAIVGVFLRVLEYQTKTVLFLTTNRPEDVDDAIASRCIARLTYSLPTFDQAVRIWQTLLATAGLKIDGVELEKIINHNPSMSGRDIKNVLKLASLDPSIPIDAERVAYIQKFKPTG